MVTFNLNDLQQLYFDVWGATPVALPTFNPAPIRQINGDYGSPYRVNDIIGREVYMPVQLIVPQTGGASLSIWLDYPIIHITSQTTVVDTLMAERKGSVHEIINIADYTITVTGFIINHDIDDLNEDVMDNYFDILEVGQPITMRNVLTDRALHPDYQVIVKKLDFPEVKGYQGIKAYELDFVSDFPYEITMNSSTTPSN